jgi:hypothetical protein
MKEVFVNINDGFIKWFSPAGSGSEPFTRSQDCPFGSLTKDEVLGRVVKCLSEMALAKGEEWSFRFNHQPKL